MPATLMFDDRETDWSTFDDALLRAASGFERLGVAEDDVVCIMLRNEPAFLVAAFAALRLGAYPCPVNWHYRADEAGWVLADSGAKMLVVHADLLPQIEGAVPRNVEVVVAAPQRALVTARSQCSGYMAIPLLTRRVNSRCPTSIACRESSMMRFVANTA